MRLSPLKTSKILFLQHDSIFENYGGVQYYIDDFLQFLSELYGAESIEVLLAQRTPRLQLSPRPYPIETVTISQGALKKLHNRFSPSYFWKALDLTKKIKPSVIIASHIHYAPMAAIISKLTKTPFFVIAYGYEVWGSFQTQDRWALKQADGIISISHWTKAILEKQGFAPDKIMVVHPSLSSDFARTSAQLTSDSEAKTKTPQFKLLTISRLNSGEQYKGHDHVLEALHLIRKTDPELQISYTIQGNGDDLLRLQKKTESLGLTDAVTFLPACRSREDLKEVYLNHDVFIMPSRFGYWDKQWRGEGFGIVYVEAAVYGLPSIAYRCGGVLDIIEDLKNGLLVEPDNIGELAKSIVRLTKDKELTARLGKKARQMALDRFVPSKIQAEIKTAFNSHPFLKMDPLIV